MKNREQTKSVEPSAGASTFKRSENIACSLTPKTLSRCYRFCGNINVAEGINDLRKFDNKLLLNIYPTKPIMDWLKDNSTDFAPTSRSKFYVAITRARNSVGIVYDFDQKKEYAGFTKCDPNNP